MIDTLMDREKKEKGGRFYSPEMSWIGSSITACRTASMSAPLEASGALVSNMLPDRLYPLGLQSAVGVPSPSLLLHTPQGLQTAVDVVARQQYREPQ
jgi:hypothetical protein